MSGITSHVLDTSLGKPAEGIEIQLEINDGDTLEPKWRAVAAGTTNDDGRVPGLTSQEVEAGHYQISFLVGNYFQRQQTESFYPVVRIEFLISDAGQHYHVPLLLNPFGYSTYRGS